MKDDFKSCCHSDLYITCQVADKADLKKEVYVLEDETFKINLVFPICQVYCIIVYAFAFFMDYYKTAAMIHAIKQGDHVHS